MPQAGGRSQASAAPGPRPRELGERIASVLDGTREPDERIAHDLDGTRELGERIASVLDDTRKLGERIASDLDDTRELGERIASVLDGCPVRALPPSGRFRALLLAPRLPRIGFPAAFSAPAPALKTFWQPGEPYAGGGSLP